MPVCISGGLISVCCILRRSPFKGGKVDIHGFAGTRGARPPASVPFSTSVEAASRAQHDGVYAFGVARPQRGGGGGVHGGKIDIFRLESAENIPSG